MKLPESQLRNIIREILNEKKGLWDNIHAKRKRGEKPNKPGDKGYPDEKSWKAAQESDETEHEDEGLVSEGLRYHIDHGVGIDKNIYRPGSTKFFALFREARRLANKGVYSPSFAEWELLATDIGEYGLHEGKEVPLDYPMLYEAEYKGREVELNKPKKGSGGKAYVYVRNPKTGKVIKVNFGSSMPDAMGDSEEHRKRRKSFGDRHNCADKKDKTKAGYWSCRATKFFGRDISGWW